ncbi:MAG: hypothetical protein J5J04_09990 [Anaerolineae bacterium]|jgi:hypothetical protein|nr:hypothetical protein [Chloroflexota bacterium]MBV6436150.1 hypothetical protein [Anaerolineae bacterium]MDL1915937.1 hypothetical protein [Anaerolineae bacterium CFX4]OQY80931.1 MAG: hypothetical protein B6D42_12165 [Anaerolineae bacterium UTCFX5]MBW7878834.1 hypothetical protein [Anaerolineae bacterium]
MNLLRNADFEDTLFVPAVTSADGFTVMRVPREWEGGALTSMSPMRWVNKVPVGAAGGRRVSGQRSYHMYCDDGTFTAWLYQRVVVRPGTPLAAGAQVFIEGVERAVARVGIDVSGGSHPYASSVIWSPWATALNKWTARAVSAVATGERATLFLYATQVAQADPNGVYWDSAYIDGTAGAVPNHVSLEVALRYNMRFRSGPGPNFPEIDRIPRDTTLVAVARTADALWVMTEYEQRTGWLAAQYCLFDGDIMRLPVAPGS